MHHLKVCMGQNADADTAINAMHEIYYSIDTEAILLIDTENTFNSMNDTQDHQHMTFLPGSSLLVSKNYCQGKCKHRETL